ncbi:Dps family protein [Bacillus sp. 03113]|uniref:Dps family protein n=1 Tax=Bacillus sp. 03113 TaxID=2578211 RepID=UPI0011419FD1|nr:DNA starvation/stationary phase protection protein [Bacillus sp. 03113]
MAVQSTVTTQLQVSLNTQIANWSVLYTKLHHFHWYVKGPSFFTLHAKFEELYDEAAGVVDQAAERLLAIGGEPISTLKEFLNTTTLTEASGEKTTNEMVASLVKDYKQLNEELKALAALAESENDSVTHDFGIELVEKNDTHIWMLTAYLGE